MMAIVATIIMSAATPLKENKQSANMMNKGNVQDRPDRPKKLSNARGDGSEVMNNRSSVSGTSVDIRKLKVSKKRNT